MQKSDKAIHSICIAAIKRSITIPYDFKWTKFYEANTDFLYHGFELELDKYGLIICSTFIDKNNFSILTTRQLLTIEDGKLSTGSLQNAADRLYGSFKEDQDKSYTFGELHLQDGRKLRYFIETGEASMVMIQGVRTLIRLIHVPG